MDDMENTTEQTASPPLAAAPVAAPLGRPSEGRIISGSALGVANKLGISPTLVRGAWVLLVFTGIGIPLYALAWLLIPGEGEVRSIGERWASRLGGSQGWIGIVLVVIALSVLAPALPFVDGGILIPTILLAGGILLYQQNFAKTAAEGTDTTMVDVQTPRTPRVPPPLKTPPSPLGQITVGATVIGLGVLALVDRASAAVDAAPRHYLALAVVILGLGVLAGTFYGRARWLIPIGLLLIPATAGAGVVEYGSTAQDQTLRPTTFAELDQIYELGAGQLTIDLTDLPWNGETVELGGSVGVGKLELIVPAGVAIDAVTEVGIGASVSPSSTEGGLGIEHNYTVGEGTAGTVTATLEVGIGEIEVHGSDFEALDPDEGEFFGSAEDLVITPASGASLEDQYAVTGDSDLFLDLSGLTLDQDRSIVLSSETGDIFVTIPEGVSYTINAVGRELFILDSFVENGSFAGEFRSGDGPVLTIDLTSEVGTITVEEGSRS